MKMLKQGICFNWRFLCLLDTAMKVDDSKDESERR